MKLKYNLIIAFVVYFLFFGIGVDTTQAQGIYSADKNDRKADNTEVTKSEDSGGGVFRAFGDGGWSQEPTTRGDDDPIGEGILILSLLSGAYALVKRNVKRKHEG